MRRKAWTRHSELLENHFVPQTESLCLYFPENHRLEACATLMSIIATILGFTSGFALLGHHETTTRLIATSLAVDASLAPLTAVIAMRRGRSLIFWAVAGFAFGMWALACVLLVRRRNHIDYPPESDAA